MSVELIEKPEREGDTSPASGKGKWEIVARVIGEANPETAILDAVLAYTGFTWYNLSLRNRSFKELGGYLYSASVEWEYNPPDGRAQDPTDSPGGTDGPGGTTPSGTPSGPSSSGDPLKGNHRFNIGGRPPKLYQSISVVDSGFAGGGPAPDHGGLINVNRKSGEVDGTEIDDPNLEMEIDVKFDRITMAFIDQLDGLVWHKNDDTWYHRPAGSVAFMGGTLNMQDDGTWGGTFKFGLRIEYTKAASSIRRDEGLELPNADISKRGWDLIEIGYRDEDDATVGMTVAKPFCYWVHEVLPDADFAGLGIGGA